MSDQPPVPTDTWLAQVRAGHAAGWERFAVVFCPVVGEWARRAGLSPADADDVTQEVFVKVRRGIGTFRPGNFVGWLYTLTRNAVADHRRRGGEPAVGGTHFQEGLARHPAPADEDEAPEPERLVAVRRVLDVVCGDFEPRTWRAFWATVVEQRDAAEVAAELGMKPENVRNAKSRVLARVRQELGSVS